MDFKEVRDGVIKTAKGYGDNYGITIDEDYALLKFHEEVGELAQAILIHRKKSRPEKHVSEERSKDMVAQEMADILGMLIVNADLLGIDLEKAVIDKWFQYH